jgi:endonuclease/exonuclease/phosphatase family metal-dependent hydrolase
MIASRSLRIGTWNIASNKNRDAIISRIAELNLDICSLQEVLLDCVVDLPLVLSSGVGDSHGYYWYFAPALSPDELDRGKSTYYGLAILSRLPLRRVASFQLGPRNAGKVFNAETEPRIMQVVVPQLDRPIIVANTHLAATDDWSFSSTRRSQATRIADILRSIATPAPLILCGDFNTGPLSSDLTELRQLLPYGYASTEGTFVAAPDRLPIDFFLSSTALAAEVSVFPAKGLSDHNIAVGDFRLA